MRRFPDDETQAAKTSIPFLIFSTVNANYFFSFFKNLVWCKRLILRKNTWNFSSVLVLKNNVCHIVTNFSSSDLLDLRTNFYFLKIVLNHTIAQKNRRIASIWQNDLNTTDVGATIIFPSESNSVYRFVLWHSLHIRNTRVPEIDWFVCNSKKWKISKSFEPF